MNKLLQDKKLLGLIGVAILLILGGSYFIFSNNKAKEAQALPAAQIEVVQNLNPSDIGLKIVPHIGNKCSTTPTPYNEVKFSIDKPSDIKHVSWQFTYDADIPASEQIADIGNGQVTQQLGSDEGQDVNTTGQYNSRYEFLGTCSKNVCRCDTGVKKINLVLKVTKTDNKIYEAKDAVDLTTYTQ